jgi:hypothetical protein
MLRRIAFAAALGFALGCGPGSECDAGECDECRSCATERDGPCRSRWVACDTDPFCSSLVGCIDECWAALDGRDEVDCERSCRGHTGGTAVAMYDEYWDCVEDACTLACEW